MQKNEILTRSKLVTWYLTKFAGYEVASRRWAPGLFGGYATRWRLVSSLALRYERPPESETGGATQGQPEGSSRVISPAS